MSRPQPPMCVAPPTKLAAPPTARAAAPAFSPACEPAAAGSTLAVPDPVKRSAWPLAPLRSRLRLACAAALLALGGGLACTTPSVPLPPPLLESLSFQQSPIPGSIVMHGDPTDRHANVRFYTFNRTGGDGVITDTGADGSFTTSPFAAVAGDDIQLYFDTSNGERSQELCTTVTFTSGLVSSNCQ
jgi:hypothetical protein